MGLPPTPTFGVPRVLVCPTARYRSARLLCGVTEPTVFFRRLAIVICERHRGPVGYVPEQFHVATVRHDVVYTFSCVDTTLVFAEVVDREGMLCQERF
jgi:hypothetical protein